jgi:hypothetical protein
VREEADRLPPGPDRDALLKKAGQFDTAAHLDDWINSLGVRPPKYRLSWRASVISSPR